jgi:hypothetical protein
MTIRREPARAWIARRWPRILTGALTVASAAILVGAGATPTTAATSSPADALQAAAHGTVSGPFGTLAFHTDGTVTFVVLECGYLPVSPGFVHTLTDCTPDTTTGRVQVQRNGYSVTQSDGTVVHFAAYVDSAGHLHLGFGPVAQLHTDRTGTVSLAPGEQLIVGRRDCRDVQGHRSRRIACGFQQDGDRTVLAYPAPDLANPGKTRTAGLVYLPGLRLLVGPELVDRVYAPS